MDAKINEWKFDEKQDIYMIYYDYVTGCSVFLRNTHWNIWREEKERKCNTPVNLKFSKSKIKMNKWINDNIINK